jgi:hypothetical protein
MSALGVRHFPAQRANLTPIGHPQGDAPTIHERACPAMREGRAPTMTRGCSPFQPSCITSLNLSRRNAPRSVRITGDTRATLINRAKCALDFSTCLYISLKRERPLTTACSDIEGEVFRWIDETTEWFALLHSILHFSEGARNKAIALLYL